MRRTDAELRMLVVGHEPATLELVSNTLAGEKVQLFTAADAESALKRLPEVRPRIVLSDLLLPGMNGLELLERVLESDAGIDFLLMTDDPSTEPAIDAIRKGACDYLSKPLDAGRLRSCVRRLVDEAATRQKTLRLDQDLIDVFQFQGMIGRSPFMLEVFAKIRRIAPHFESVLLTGETGTGKDLVARALHNLSPLPSAPFAVCNCSALVETLLESELFGHVRGAFTGAVENKQGIFEYASGGTVFLDEIGELALPAQAKLLRVLQNREVQRVGSPTPHTVEVRVIAATNRDLRKMVAGGQFREDLFYRLSAIEISVPSLGKRKEDLPLLERHFLKKYAARYKKEITGIARRAQARLAAHSWPGNVRELENAISGSCIMATGNVIDLADLPEMFRVPVEVADYEERELVTLETVQQRYLLKVLDVVGGNKARAAEILGVGRNTIYQMLSRMGESSEVLSSPGTHKTA
ncbi:MAG TPA: sigma-54 dependent transcriptional regulator [Terriglobales bacterium]|nr:sigma-54 dependent transcriptional regulator [Terriglobales bacterium]